MFQGGGVVCVCVLGVRERARAGEVSPHGRRACVVKADEASFWPIHNYFYTAVTLSTEVERVWGWGVGGKLRRVVDVGRQ